MKIGPRSVVSVHADFEGRGTWHWHSREIGNHSHDFGKLVDRYGKTVAVRSISCCPGRGHSW